MNRSHLAGLLALLLIATLAVPAGAAPLAAAGTPAQEDWWAPFPPPPSAPNWVQAGPYAPVAWVLKSPSPQPHMDSAVIWTVGDGGLWSVSGLWTAGATQRYDPITDTWSLGAVAPWPAIQEPVDACYGYDANMHEVIILFPDTTGSVVGWLQVYDVTANAWVQWPTPAGFPPTGQWAHDIVSTFSAGWDIPYPYYNKCYISGGATVGWPGGGNLSTLWVYDPVTNTIANLGNFTHIAGGFNWHASWWVPWVGMPAVGAICVAGGVDANLVLWPTTQCYDLAAGVFLPPNVPLGPIPLPLGGAADGWKWDGGQYQIWLMNGLDPNLVHWQGSAWIDAASPAWQIGPPMAAPTYRTEGDDWNGHLYAEGGSFLLFNPQTHNQFLVQEEILLKAHVSKMKMTWRYAARPGRYKVMSQVQVHDQAHVLLPGATVAGDYTLPDGTLISMAKVTGATGVAKFPYISTQVGVHQFCVTGIAKAGYVYDPASNHFNPPCKSLQVGP